LGVPVYNGETTVERPLQAIQRKTCPDLEIIVDWDSDLIESGVTGELVTHGDRAALAEVLGRLKRPLDEPPVMRPSRDSALRTNTKILELSHYHNQHVSSR
jgi:hypothetical protein